MPAPKTFSKNTRLQIFGLALVILLTLISSYLYFNRSISEKTASVPPVTELRTSSPSSPKPTASQSASPKSSPASASSVAIKQPGKATYTIAAFGDSMIDTMGENLDYLEKSLKTKYPKTIFKMYNYGIGSQNIIEGLNRFHSPFNYKTRNHPPIDQINPDIIILGSFSYNPLSPYDRASHQKNLESLINEARKTKAQIYVLAEIAPLRSGFGRGPGGIDWTEEMIQTQVEHILEQLDDTVATAKAQNVYLVNAYQASKTDGRYGNRLYVATHDGIHPSIEGQIFVAGQIASVLKL
jgi:lysophospholipase L1-like esterase